MSDKIILCWINTSGIRTSHRWPLLWAVVGLLLCIGGVISGSILQGMLHLPLRMGWLQQIMAALVALAFAAALRDVRGIIGLQKPQAGWGWTAIGGGLAIALAGIVADAFLPSAPAPLGTEYIVYEATMPGLGEEFSMRGVWLGLLMLAVSRWPRWQNQHWLVLTSAAIPFAGLHLLEAKGLQALVIFLITLFAGIVLGWTRFRTGSIWPAVVAHNIANLGMAAYDYLQLLRH